MSNKSLNNHIPLNEIVVPSLNDVGYANGLSDAFNNINDNFARLSNYDFIKGERGTSVEIQEARLMTQIDGEWVLTTIGRKFKECIESLSDSRPQERESIKYEDADGMHEISLFDNLFADPENAKINLLYNIVNDVDPTPVPVSSLYYVFLDGRYANNVIGKIDPALYTNIKDFSCIVVYDKDVVSAEGGTGGFRALSNTFPTIYYERGVGLCWKVNGNPTGIPVQGVPGRDGNNSTLHIVKCQYVNIENSIIKGEVNGVYSTFDGYINMDDVEDLSTYDNSAALILTPDNTEFNGSRFYFGYLSIVDGKLVAICDQETAINVGIETETIINAFKNIDILNNGDDASSGLKGLFIPMIRETNGKQPVHFISATSITNTNGQASDMKSDIIMSPIKDINSLNVVGEPTDEIIDGKGNLVVDKYLYLKVNKNCDFITNAAGSSYFSALQGTDYVLKYKLSTVVDSLYDPNDPTKINRYFGVYDEINNTAGSRHFGDVVVNGSIVTISDPNTIYYNVNGLSDNLYESSNGTDSIASVVSMPVEFVSRITGDNPTGIYRWELCEDKADYDVDELLAVENPSYNFPKAFNAIYTTTINPSISSDFMWFNGFEVVYNSNDVISADDPDNTNGYNMVAQQYYTYGWNYGNNDSIFSFLKFVPLYDNDFNVKEDTTLNINYNVNITGDQLNPNKNITVHGSVNCDDLSVYKLTATGEIKDIFTKDTIIGQAGIKLGVQEDGHTYHVNISNGGEIMTDEGITAKYVRCYNPDTDPDDATTLSPYTVKADNLKARQAKTNELFVNNLKQQTKLFIGGNGNSNDDGYVMELQDWESVDITRTPNTLNNDGMTVFRTDMPTLQCNESNIIVSNQDKTGNQLYYLGAKTNGDTNYKHNAGIGVSSKTVIDEVNFDSAKNFNINRLSLTNTPPIKKLASTAGFSDDNITVKFTSTLTDILKHTQSMSEEVGNSTLTDTVANAMYTFDIYKGTNQKFNRSNNLSIVFNNDFVTRLGIYGQCSNGKWPVLWNTSYMELNVYYEVQGENRLNHIPSLTKKFSINYSTNTTANDSGYEWVGNNASGGSISGYGEAWRYYAFKFRPSKMELQYSKAEFKSIADSYDLGKRITFYIIPKFYMYAQGQKGVFGRRSVVGGLSATKPVAISSSGTTTEALNKIADSYIKPSVYTGKSSLTVNYYIDEISEGAQVNSTTICDDGIVIRSNKYTFGLGYSDTVYNHRVHGYNKTYNTPEWANKSDTSNLYIDGPVLFYHEYDNGYYDSSGLPKSGTAKEAYARRTNAIALKDLFAFLASQHGTWQYGV